MIRPLTFDCTESRLAGVLHPGGERGGLLVVAGGRQTRVGPHRLFTAIAAGMAARGLAALRFDRRGVGDSDGEDSGFLGSAADIAAAAHVLRREAGEAKPLVGFGLCDGAAALALFAAEAGLTHLVLLNPWSFDGDAPPAMPPAAARRRLLRRLTSVAAWRRLLSGAVDIRGAMHEVSRPPTAAGDLAERIVASINAFGGPILVVLSANDTTAQHFAALLPRLGEHVSVLHLAGADHTLTRPEDVAALIQAVDSIPG